ncbi:hypothetical protein QBC47DRAFT_428537 [Echria macrotheca]|uniref:Rhodopsin domain-containing protein n=1 Tax=Echria macrotheca TaxID=438768 RepID=A0AAJ0BMT7_9PEZI|nr:hypothetical protein QBC47DRAFT_428537 [Echria macrotheca]
MATPQADLSGGPVLLSFSLATGSFALATTVVRFCVRAGINNHIGADDYASGVATLVALIGTIFGIVESTTSDPTRALEFDVLGQPWYLMSATLSRISICLLFIGLLGRGRQWRILLGILIFLMAAVNFGFALAMNLQCRPLEKLWRPNVAGECWDSSVQLNFGYFQGAFSVFSWSFLAAFPVLIVRDLKIDGTMTWPFYVTSSLSFTCAIFTIVKTADASQINRVPFYTSHSFYASLMANLEQNMGLIAANVLTLGPLFSASARHMLTSGSSRSGKGPSRAGSTRPITRASSRASARSSNPDTEGDIDLDRKPGGRRTSLIIEGPRRDSFDGQRSRSQNSMRSRNNFIDDGTDGGHGDEDDYDIGSRSYRHHHRRGGSIDEVDLEAWPRGIIKTVSVEVVEEVNEDYHTQHANHQRQGSRGGVESNTNGSRLVPMVRAASRAGDNSNRVSGASGLEQDWETMLRNGPPGK